MNMIISDPLFLPSLSKPHHYYPNFSQETTRYNSEVKLRTRFNNISSSQQKQFSSPVLQTNSLTINESLPVRIQY